MAVSLPTISSTTGTLTAAGVGSGLDVKGLVSQLMAVEQRPLTLLTQQETGYQSELSSFGTIKSALSALSSAAQTLAAARTAAYTASSSDTSFLTAAASSSAVGGSSSITVSQLAQGEKITSATRVPAEAWNSSTSASIGSGSASTVTITLGTLDAINGTFTADPARSAVSLAINSSNNSLAGIRDAINAADAGVTASIVSDGSAAPYRLVLASDTTGETSTMNLTVSGDADIAALLSYDPTAAPSNFDRFQSAQNASLVVDGVPVTSTSNTVTDAIQGVTLNLLKAPTTSAVAVTVQRTASNLTTALNTLVTAYNSVNSAIASATAKGAVLQGDWATLSMQRQVRSLLGSTQSAGGSYTTLSQLGISFQKDGSLLLDSAKLSAATSTNLNDVTNLSVAIGNALNSATSDMLAFDGTIANQTAGINRLIDDLGTRRTQIQRRLDATQARYMAQFAALDTLLSSMNSTSTFLTQQLSALTNSNTGG